MLVNETTMEWENREARGLHCDVDGLIITREEVLKRKGLFRDRWWVGDVSSEQHPSEPHLASRGVGFVQRGSHELGGA